MNMSRHCVPALYDEVLQFIMFGVELPRLLPPPGSDFPRRPGTTRYDRGGGACDTFSSRLHV